MELSTLRPKNLKEMRSVHGIGSRKLDAFGDIFLSVIRNYSIDDTSGEKLEFRSFESDRSQRSFVIGNAFNSGGSLQDIAELYKIKPERVLFHLHRHCLSGNDINTEKLKESLSLPEDKCKAVLDSFRELGTERLSPIHEKFNGSIKYIDLHILRIIFLQWNKKNLKEN
jgi:ATP-dependent DNA helicase RecQ